MRGYRLYIALLFVAATFYVITQTTREKPTDWSPDFTGTQRMPYGCFILRERLADLFPKASIVDQGRSPYTVSWPGDSGGSYLVINDQFGPDDLDLAAMLEFVERGNTLFVAANRFSKNVQDTLGLLVSSSSLFSADSTTLGLVNPNLRTTTLYSYRPGIIDRRIERFDTTRWRVVSLDAEGKPVLIRTPWGKGTIMIGSAPFAYTNHAMLAGDNADYVAQTLSYLSPSRIIWDEYYKIGRRDVETPMRYFWSEPALTSAFWVGMAGVALFMISMGRRRQRVIPVVQPPANTTIEFVETVGRLYHQHGDYRDLAEKKVAYFLEHLRSRYGVNALRSDDDGVRSVASRCGVREETVRGVIAATGLLQARSGRDVDVLIGVNRAIESFYDEEKMITQSGYRS